MSIYISWILRPFEDSCSNGLNILHDIILQIPQIEIPPATGLTFSHNVTVDSDHDYEYDIDMEISVTENFTFPVL